MPIPNPRAIASAIRTFLYGGITASCIVQAPETLTAWGAALAGALLADYVTWMIRALLLLPSNIWHGSYDCIVNILFGWFLWRYVAPGAEIDGESVAFAFLTFMLVLVVKIVYYTAKLASDDFED